MARGALARFDPLTCGGVFKDYRRRLGLPVPDGWNVVDARLSPHRNVGLMSPHYLEAAPDWPPGYELVGFTPWAGPDHGALDDDVHEFLRAGDSPVVVTLGTSAASAKPEVFARVADALSRAGHRGIFLTSNAEIATQLHQHVGPSSPHGIWRLRAARAAARPLPRHRALRRDGTNALALGAGIPSVILPCLFDQRWHAERQQNLGTGIWAGDPVTSMRPSAGRCRTAWLADRARDFGALLAPEDGTSRACDAAETILGKTM